MVSLATTVIKPELGTKPKVFYVAADHQLKGRITFSEDFKEEILEYNRSIPSPDASYWKKGEGK
jgi:hypothetical protein